MHLAGDEETGDPRAIFSYNLNSVLIARPGGKSYKAAKETVTYCGQAFIILARLFPF